MKYFVSLVLFTLILLPSVCFAQNNVTMCFKMSVLYEDSAIYSNGSGPIEDVWADPGFSDKALIGSKIRIYTITYVPGQGIVTTNYYQGNLSSSIFSPGCVNLSVPSDGRYYVAIESEGSVLVKSYGWPFSAFNLRVEDRQNGSTGVVNSYIDVDSSGTYNLTLSSGPYADEFRTYLVGSLALQRTGLAKPNFDYRARVGSPSGTIVCPACYSYDNRTVYLDSETSERKFRIAHEFGHAFADSLDLTPVIRGHCSDWTFPANGDCISSGGHHLRSHEASKCASTEGFAEFFSAITWNNPGTDGISVVKDPLYPFGILNMGSNGHASKYIFQFMKNRCSPSWSANQKSGDRFQGTGNEMDWSRMYWYMNNRCSNSVSLSSMVNWLKNTTLQGSTQIEQDLMVFNSLTTEASYDSSLYSCWATASYNTGTQWPWTP